MFNTFNTGLSGLRAHQTLLDVVGNNLANVNTPGYWSSRVSFADMLSQTVRSPSAPTGNQGGINPSQLGTGVLSTSIDKMTAQGAINPTGRVFDLALQGQGFFVLNDGSQDRYTRVGTFGFDSENFLVDTRTGYRVQSNQGGSLQIDPSATVPAQATSEIEMAGNLPAVVTGPLQEILTSQNAFEQATAAQASGVVTLPPPDGSFSISVDGRQPVNVTLTGVTTIGEVITEINNAITGATAIEDPGNPGTLLITSDTTGERSSLLITDGTAGTALALGLPLDQTLRGTQDPATGTTELNDLKTNTADYAAGDQIQITGIDGDGNFVNAIFKYGAGVGEDGTTLQDLVDKINGAFTGTNASLDANGNLVLSADADGPQNLSLNIADIDGSAGGTTFSTHGMAVTQNGTGPDQVLTEVEVFDSQGRSYALTLTFERQGENEWNMTASSDEDGVTLSDNSVDGIRFGADGRVLAIADDARSIGITFPGLGEEQVVSFAFGLDSELDGISQFGDQSSAFAASQNGFAAGSLNGLSVGAGGEVMGLFSNGQVQLLETIGLANFTNPEGLQADGDSLYTVSPNSGSAQTFTPDQGGATRIISGALEGSNVDLTAELVKLIGAQRGFQVNARSINASNVILQEAINIVQ